MSDHSVVEICAGAGGQAFGMEQAGFSHELAVELDSYACRTLQGKDTFTVKDAIEHNNANRDNVDVDNFDNPVTNKNAADTFH